MLDSLNYCPFYADPNVRMSPAVKWDGYQYWEYILCYLDDILCISHKPEETMKGIKADFKLKDDKVEETTYYLGDTVSKIKNEDGVECWVVDSNKYCDSAVKMSSRC